MLNMLRTTAALAGLVMLFTLSVRTPTSAQPTSPCGYWSDGTWISTPCQQPPSYQNNSCGYWSEGTWVATPCAPRPQRVAVSGTIVGVDNNMLTVQTGPTRTVLVNDEPALNRMATGRIFTGRVITAYGHWGDGEFIATSIA
jgi:hypothetical protein